MDEREPKLIRMAVTPAPEPTPAFGHRLIARDNELEHGGRLPKSLDEVSRVLIPMDPAMDQPFPYKLDGKTAVLDLPDLGGHDPSGQRFEVSVVQ